MPSPRGAFAPRYGPFMVNGHISRGHTEGEAVYCTAYYIALHRQYAKHNNNPQEAGCGVDVSSGFPEVDTLLHIHPRSVDKCCAAPLFLINSTHNYSSQPDPTFYLPYPTNKLTRRRRGGGVGACLTIIGKVLYTRYSLLNISGQIVCGLISNFVLRRTMCTDGVLPYK